jgi:predicted amidohydrolase YtcJ
VAKLVFVNGQIVTVDERFSVRQAVAVADGKIIAVGSDDAALAAAGTGAEVTDLRGATVIPGLIDNHNHFVRGAVHWPSEVRLDGVTTREEVLGRLRERAAGLADGEWLLTLGGWHTDQLRGDRSDLTLAELDAVAGEHPAFIQVGYSHAFANGALLDALGVARVASAGDAGPVPGVARDDAGRATGRINGGIVSLNAIARRFPRLAGEPEAGVRAAAAYYNSIGLTTVFDPGGVGVADSAYDQVAAVARKGELTLRVFTTLGDAASAATPEQCRHILGRIRSSRPFQGNHWYDRLAVGEVFYGPFHWDHPGVAPDPRKEDVAAADEILRTAAVGGWPVQAHSVTGEGIDLVLSAYERASAHQPIRALRWSITHAEGITAGQVERARRLGVTLQIRSMGVMGGQERAVAAYGAEAVRAMPPLRMIADSGLPWGLGTDGTKAAQLNPFVTLWWAVTGRGLGGEMAVDPALTLSREEALIAHTRSNAWLMFQEGFIGAIRPGLRADMLVLDRDYLTVPAEEIKDIRPAATIVDGALVYRSAVHGSLLR